MPPRSPARPSSPLRELGTPALFVFLWSTGFIGAKLGLPHAGPLTFLTLRFALAAALLAVLALLSRAPWPGRRELGHCAVAGLLLQGVYLGGVFVGISLGVGAGLAALIVSAQPLLVAALAGLALGERVTARQWLGLALGLLGVLLVLAPKLGHGPGDALGALACLAALLAITAGTLYQKRYLGGIDLRTGSAVQYAAAGLATGLPALVLEDNRVVWSGGFIVALLWLVLVLSLGAVSLFYLLIRRGAASSVSNLFFLVPPTTALFGWFLFGETLGPFELAGMALAVVGVGLASRRGR
jgi:drug/metabolite transporter (DMT)-like permease